MTPAINSSTVGAAPKAAKKPKFFSVEDLERLVVKIAHQLGNDRPDIESDVACLRRLFVKIGPDQTGPILNAIFDARFDYFIARFKKFGVAQEKVAIWKRSQTGSAGEVFGKAIKMIAEAKAKLPICRCGRHELTYAPDNTLYKVCWECAKERKFDRRDAQPVPARLAAPSAADRAAFVSSAAGQKMMGLAMLGAMDNHTFADDGLVFEIRNFAEMPVVTLPPRRQKRAEKFTFKKKVTPRKNGKTAKERSNGKWQRHLANQANFAAQQSGHVKGKSGEIKAKGSSKKAKK